MTEQDAVQADCNCPKWWPNYRRWQGWHKPPCKYAELESARRRMEALL